MSEKVQWDNIRHLVREITTPSQEIASTNAEARVLLEKIFDAGSDSYMDWDEVRKAITVLYRSEKLNGKIEGLEYSLIAGIQRLFDLKER